MGEQGENASAIEAIGGIGEGRDKGRGGEGEIGVEVEDHPRRDDPADMDQDEDHHDQAGQGLKLMDEILFLRPDFDDQRDTGQDLDEEGQHHRHLDDGMAIDQPRRLHELRMGLDTQQTDKMIGKMQAQKGKDKAPRYLMQSLHSQRPPVKALTMSYFEPFGQSAYHTVVKTGVMRPLSRAIIHTARFYGLRS